MVSDLLGIFLASASSGGENLLFRYPSESDDGKSDAACANIVYGLDSHLINRYSLYKHTDISSIKDNLVVGLDNKTIALLLIGQGSKCKIKFELSINDVIFVGFPNSLKINNQQEGDFLNFNVAFALKSTVSPWFIPLYQELSELVSLALIHEQLRDNFLWDQKHKILNIHEQVHPNESHSKAANQTQLCHFLKLLFDELQDRGSVDLWLNRWSRVCYCLNPKVSRFVETDELGHHKSSSQNNSTFTRVQFFKNPTFQESYTQAIRPYHTFILLEERKQIIERLTIDNNPIIFKLLKIHSPTKDLVSLAAELDVPLSQVKQLVSSFVAWGLVMIIFPIYDHNIYLISPKANLSEKSAQASRFNLKFPDSSLLSTLAQFSSSYDLSYHRKQINFSRNKDLNYSVSMIVWLLKYNFIYQVHKYVFHLQNDLILNHESKTSARRDGVGKVLNKSYSAIEEKSNEEISGIGEASECDTSQFPATLHLNKGLQIFSDKKKTLASSIGESRQDLVSMTQTPRPQSVAITTSFMEKVSLGGSYPPGSWKSEENLSIPQLPEPKINLDNISLEDNQLFIKLKEKYFNGEHHLEDIMFCENLPRSKLSSIIDRFRDRLVVCQHEEPFISFWVQ